MPEEYEVLTAKDVAHILKCSRSMVYKLRREGILLPRWQLFPGQRGWRWSLADIREYLDRCDITARLESGGVAPKFVPITLESLKR